MITVAMSTRALIPEFRLPGLTRVSLLLFKYNTNRECILRTISSTCVESIRENKDAFPHQEL